MRYYIFIGPVELLPENISSVPIIVDHEKKKIIVNVVSTRASCIEHLVWDFDEDWLIINRLSDKFKLLPLSEVMLHYEILI